MNSRPAPDFLRMMRRKILALVGVYRARDAWPQGVISFTFDDFPKSALTAGGSILERHGARGTYYVASKLAKTEGAVGRSFDVEDIVIAHGNGHEIGCHTYTHLNCAEAKEASLQEEVRANAAALAATIKEFSPRNFAYPFGAVSPLAAQVLNPHFSSCRGIRPGINEGRLNLSELLANSLYATTFDEARLCSLIDRNVSAGGWLIFYTHDVCETPSPYGCKPGQFEAIVAYAAKRAPIRTVQDVLGGLDL